MTGEELIKKIRAGQLPTVRFTKAVEDCDGYFDENMIAQAVAYNLVEMDMVEVIFYTKDHDEHNTKVEKCNYFDKEGKQPIWSARQANCHPERTNWKESVYIGLNDDCPFVIVSTNTIIG